jgi:hypothetical protein
LDLRVPWWRRVNDRQLTEKLLNHLLKPNILQKFRSLHISMRRFPTRIVSDRWGRGRSPPLTRGPGVGLGPSSQPWRMRPWQRVQFPLTRSTGVRHSPSLSSPLSCLFAWGFSQLPLIINEKCANDLSSHESTILLGAAAERAPPFHLIYLS